MYFISLIDIWGRSDQFHFYYTEVPSDENVVIEFYVEHFTKTLHEWAKGGLMIRGTLSEDSSHFSLLATGRNGLANEFRTCTGGQSYHYGSTAIPDRKVRIRLTKIGNVFQAHYRSSKFWIPLGNSEAIKFSSSDTFFVGVALSSHDSSRRVRLDGSNLRM